MPLHIYSFCLPCLQAVYFLQASERMKKLALLAFSQSLDEIFALLSAGLRQNEYIYTGIHYFSYRRTYVTRTNNRFLTISFTILLHSFSGNLALLCNTIFLLSTKARIKDYGFFINRMDSTVLA